MSVIHGVEVRLQIPKFWGNKPAQSLPAGEVIPVIV